MLTLAYGGFRGLSDQDAWNIAFPILLRMMISNALFYLTCSILAEYFYHRGYLVIVLFMILPFVLGPEIGGGGEYGPTHVAVGVGCWFFYVLFILLAIKVVWLNLCPAAAKRGLRVA